MAQSIKLGNDTYLDWTGIATSNTGLTLDNRLQSFQYVHNFRQVATESITLTTGAYLIVVVQLGAQATFGIWFAKVTPYASGCTITQIVSSGSLPTLTVGINALNVTAGSVSCQMNIIRVM